MEEIAKREGSFIEKIQGSYVEAYSIVSQTFRTIRSSIVLYFNWD